MKTLLFLRHGKSDWDAEYGHDHDRPLAKRGRKAARRMGQLIADAGPVPNRVVCSTAVRARRTLALAQEAGDWTADVEHTERLYGANPSDLLEIAQAQNDATGVLMLVGHEPTWSETIALFIGGGTVRYPTAALARIDLDVGHWRDISFGDGRLIWLIPPKLLG